jgi:hypothetical protein
MLRRVIALFLALCFGFFSAESLVADVHDGDAPASEQSRYAGVVHAGQSSAADLGDAHTHSGDENAETSGHSLHACHGAHAHIGMTADGMTLPGDGLSHESVPAAAECAPVERRREPQLRPPIA